jgi:hypothetical protein
MIASIVGVAGIVGAVVYQNMPEKGDEPPDDESRKKSADDLDDLNKPKDPPPAEPTIPAPGLPPNQPPVEPIPEPTKPIVPDRIPPPDKTNVVYDATGKFPLYWEVPAPDLGADMTRKEYNRTQITEAYLRGDRSFCEGPLRNFCGAIEAQKGIEDRRQQAIDAQILGISPEDPRTDLERLMDLTLWNGSYAFTETPRVAPALPYNTRASAEYLDTQCRQQKIGFDYKDPGYNDIQRGFSQDECNKLANNYPVRWFPNGGGCIMVMEKDGRQSMGTNFSTGCGALPKFSDAQ